MFEGFSTGLTLGLATGTVCLASCGPIYASYLMGERRTGFQPLWVILKLNGGRFIAYVIFGGLVGMLGGAIPVTVRIPLTLTGYILFSLYLLLSVVRIRKACTGCHTGKVLKITRSPFLLGILTGFSVCPSFLIALTGAFGSSGPVSGMMLFIGFFVGTTVYMLPFALFGLLTMKDWITKAARMIAVVVAIYFGAMGVRGLVTWITRPSLRSQYEQNAVETSGISDTDNSNIFSIEDSDTLYIVSFSDDDDDMGSQLAEEMNGTGLPPIKLVKTTTDGWREEVAPIPGLSAVIVPHWVDERSGIGTEQWQDTFTSYLVDMRMRTFAVEYQPYCAERVRGIQSFLKRYSFVCHPDSGFVFLMMNPLTCSPAECSTCDILH
ncbi:MAG: sulfite exporter TauE/SafE family protein [Candidatus Aegiribacteria sp.]|nr:sulfite exporter TauE/SafE family protein [Candidatus Aegiribacteria sp.]